MQTLLSAFTLLVVLFSASIAQAQSACGGTMQMKSDLMGNKRNWHYSCCPEGYRVQGVAYTDIRKQDHVDAVSVVCRSIAKGNDIMPEGDFQRTPKTFVCEKNEVMAGIFTKDVKVEGGDHRDSMDGLTAVCQKPNSKELRTVYNKDLDGGRQGNQQVVYLPKRVVGLACKELDKGSSDRSDGCTIITK